MDGISPSYQTARLGPGRHKAPGAVVCVMELASYVLGSFGREGLGWLRRRGWWSDEDHKLYLWLVDRLIELGVDTSSRSWLLSRLAENVQATVEAPAPTPAAEAPAEELALVA